MTVVATGNLIRLANRRESGDARTDDRFSQVAGKRANQHVPVESMPPARVPIGAPVVDNFSRYLHTAHSWFIYIACSRPVPPRRLNQSAPEIVSISSEGLYLYLTRSRCRGGWGTSEGASALSIDERGAQRAMGLQQCVGSLFRESTPQLWFSSFVRRMEHFHLP